MGEQVDRRGFLKLGVGAGLGALAASALVGCGAAPADSGNTRGGTIDLTDWDSIVEAAKGQTVTYYGNGYNELLNNWQDSFVADYLKTNYDISWNRVATADTLDIVTQISSEMQAGVTEGSVDFLWVNGENFYTLKNAGYLYGPMSGNLPSNKYLNPMEFNNVYDTGIQIFGYEASWVQSFYSFFGDSAKVDAFPKTPNEFLEFCKKYPGKVTYCNVADFTGNRFISTFILNVIGAEAWETVALDLTLSKEDLKKIIDPGLEYLRELNPYLWSKGESYPTTSGQVDQMYADGELFVDYAGTFPQKKMDSGVYPASTKVFNLKYGLANFSSLAIPTNAVHKAAALVAINAMGLPELQASNYLSTSFLPVIDFTRLSDSEKAAFDGAPLGPGMVEIGELAAYTETRPMPSGPNIDLIEALWNEEVAGKQN